VNPNETIFTPTYVSSHTFSAMTYATDGLIYAQPLFITGLNGSNEKVGACPSPANIAFVATENNSVYAFEAPPFPPSGGGMCWQIKLNNVGETAIPYTDLPTQCENLLPQVGITGTPVIDVTVTPPILYVVTSHKISATAYAERLHAIDTTTGLEEPNSPVDIAGALGSNFDIITQNQRPGLALSHSAGNLANVYTRGHLTATKGTTRDGWPDSS
jgi:hypothetical protein